jgi:hypothetical protein
VLGRQRVVAAVASPVIPSTSGPVSPAADRRRGARAARRGARHAAAAAHGTTLFGRTVETVLADRPCGVIIEPEPATV